MHNKSQNISARLSQEDYDFMMAVDWNGARTQSEKLREIIQHVRRETEVGANPGESFSNAQLTLLPTLTRIKNVESAGNVHSALIEMVVRALPDIIAALRLPDNASAQELLESEQSIAQYVFRLIDSVMRMGITPTAPCLDPHIIHQEITGLAPLMKALLELDHLKGEK